MFLKTRIKALTSLSFRLTYRFTILLMVSHLLFLLGVTVVLRQGLLAKDRNLVHARQNELSAILETEGVSVLIHKLHQANEIQNNLYLLVRVVDTDGRIIFNQLPQGLDNFSPETIEKYLQLAFTSHQSYSIKPRNFGQETIEIVSTPVLNRYVLITGLSTEESVEVIGIFLEAALIVALGSILISVLFGYFYSKNALQPIRSLIRIIKEIQRGSTKTLVPEIGRKDELSDLIDLFNKMILQVNQLIDSLQMSLDSIAHDLRTPITHLTNRFEAVLDRISADDQSVTINKDFIHESLEEVQGIASLLTTLLEISRAQSGSIQIVKVPFSLRDLFNECVELYEYVGEEKEARIIFEGKDITIVADRNRFKRVLANLIDNALKYSDAGVHIFVSGSELPESWLVSVRDTGWGIAENDQNKIWERLYRGDSSRSTQGMGLGLSFIKSIIEMHGGNVIVQSETGKGSIFEIRVPKPKIKKSE
jgi:signal transduction histidine kinase